MITYKNILFCTDFSKNAQAALPHAIDLTKKYGATLHLLHVYHDAGHIAEFEMSSDTKTDLIRVAHMVTTEMERRLDALCTEVEREVGPCRKRTIRGTPHVEIVRYAREEQIDLLVLSSHGLTGLEHVIFGGTTERVVRHSPCDVMVIKSRTT